jgi:hypothetical protein
MLLIEGSTIHQIMPLCIEIYEGKYGFSIRSTKYISKDTIIDGKVSFCFINNEDNKLYSLVIDDHDSGGGGCSNFDSLDCDGSTRCITRIMNECVTVILDT